ncbi:MAG: AbrB/MazE/SpoVT family DNA-binding domain-containing protein [Candidatus Tantalella remota]|nr:AbrB/MazE/SpoVT family DNA-binding domain-containing protein [Candidatus Tantalella remota]
MRGKNRFKFSATVSDRGQIFIPKVLQGYFDLRSRDKVEFVVNDDGTVIFKKKRGASDEGETA